MKDRDETCAEFRRSAVNMDADELEQWLHSPESLSVGQVKPGETESQGHMSGRRVLELLKKEDSQLTDDDVDHMHKVVRNTQPTSFCPCKHITVYTTTVACVRRCSTTWFDEAIALCKDHCGPTSSMASLPASPGRVSMQPTTAHMTCSGLPAVQISYVKRHTAQRPNKSEQELEHSRWTSSLRNWGHDPMKQPDHEYAEHEGAEDRSG